MKQTKSARTETADIESVNNPPEKRPRILLFDVESSPNLGYSWGKFEQNIIEFVSERQIICFAWKWLGEKNIHALALPMFGAYQKDRQNNKELIIKLHTLISQADVIVGHNIDEFDDKMSNTGFIKHGLQPPPPHRTVDTLKFARHKFRFNSNRLGDLGEFLGLGGKVRHSGFELWKKCLAGDSNAWNVMLRYNKGDVRLLEKIYLKERPWMIRHQSMSMANGKPGCPICSGPRLVRHGYAMLSNGYKKPRFQCQDCGKWCQGDMVQGEWRFK